MSSVLAVDPGGMTGWAWCAHVPLKHGERVFDARQDDFLTFTKMAHNLAAAFGADLTIVVERFTISQRTLRATKGGSYDAIETIGVLRYLSRSYCEKDLVMQQPSDVMNLITDERLKRMGWYQPGKVHANDALRHLAVYLAQGGIIRLPS